MITREEVIKLNKQKSKAHKAQIAQDVTSYLTAMAEHIRDGKFITRGNMYVQAIRGDKDFHDAVLRHLTKEGFTAEVVAIKNVVPTTAPVRQSRSKYERVAEKYQLRLDLNVG